MINFNYIFFLIIPCLCFTQNYNGPESVEYNPNTGSYFISNSGNGQILELNSSNELSVFVSNVGTGPHGLEIVNNILYACSGGRLKGYDLNSGIQVLNYNLSASFLNGITHIENVYGDGNPYLYITDFSENLSYCSVFEDFIIFFCLLNDLFNLLARSFLSF